jgi:hypothetical protein
LDWSFEEVEVVEKMKIKEIEKLKNSTVYKVRILES